MSKVNQLVYPITLDYVEDWGEWEVVREIASNAMDADADFTMGINADGALVIKSRGGNLAVRHLLLGVSEKRDATAIGQFGEGLKLAMLVLTRMGLTAHVYSGGRHIWNEPAHMEGEQVFKIRWQTGFRDNGMTVIGIPDWPGETFEERFIREGDPRVRFTGQFGRMILEEAQPGIYVKGVWVQPSRLYHDGFAFGYNLQDVDMNRDRGVIRSWNLARNVGKVWSQVADQDLLARFWQAVKDGQAEKHAHMGGATVASETAMKRGFQAAFGDVVVATSEEMTREARYRGAKTVAAAETGDCGLAEVVKAVVGTDADYVEQMTGQSKVWVPPRDLAAEAKRNLRLLRRLARRAGFQGKVEAYILPERALAQLDDGEIHVSTRALEAGRDKAVKSLIHELAHAKYGAADATREMVDAVAYVGANLVLGYAVRS